MKSRFAKWSKIVIPGAALLQITACFGADPQYYLTSTVTDALVYNTISAIFTVVTNLFTTTAALLG